MTNSPRLKSADEFLIIGHRGAAGLELENSLSSFRRAVELAVDAIEFDVHRVDDQIVVIHDDTLDRTTRGEGRISSFSFEHLRDIPLNNGEQIPTLQEALDVIPHQMLVNVELKGLGCGVLTGRILRGYRRPLMLSSFHQDELFGSYDRLEQELSGKRDSSRTLRTERVHKYSVLANRLSQERLRFAQDIIAYSINLNDRRATKESIEIARTAGYEVIVFTVNSPKRARLLRFWGASGVFTDRPDIVTKSYVCAD